LTALTPWHAAILGLVEGITEYLPVSSTGHLILVTSLLGLDRSADAKRNIDAFEIVIQGGAILAVVGLYWPRIVQIAMGLIGKNPAGFRLAINLAIAFIPAAILGVLLKDRIEQHLFHPAPVLAALGIGGLAMIIIGRWQRAYFRVNGDDPSGPHSFVDLEHLTWKRALLIGALQCLALWPGTSRSMVTIVGGMIAGMRPKHAAEFSFLLGLPTLGGACLYSLAKNLRGGHPNMFETLGPIPIVIGIAVAAISAAIAVRWLVGFLSRHGLSAFGWYRIALCAVMAILVWRGVIDIRPHASKVSPTADRHVSSRLLREDLLHQIAIADADRLAQEGTECIAQFRDRGMAHLDVEPARYERLELDEQPKVVNLIEVDAHIVDHPNLAQL